MTTEHRFDDQVLSKAIYTTCYCAAYGVTFPIVFLTHLIPGGRMLGAGFGDGARAAMEYVRAAKRSRRAPKPIELDVEPELSPAY